MPQVRIAAAQRAAAAGRLGTSDWAPEHLELGLEGAIAQIQNIPLQDKLVVCHGDACAPNTLITDDGRWSGHVDLGDLGVADRLANRAIATWSTEWNYGPGWSRYCSTPTGSSRTHSAPATTGCSGNSASCR